MAVQLSLAGLDLPRIPRSVEAVRPLWHYPQVSGSVICEHAVLIGSAGEALVDSLLLRYGLLPMCVPGGLASDRMVYTSGGLVRLQVKTCAIPRDGAYAFNAMRGYRNAPQGTRVYDVDDFDVLALVGLADNVVWFTHRTPRTFRILVSAIPGLRADPRASLEQALLGLGIDLTADAAETVTPCAA